MQEVITFLLALLNIFLGIKLQSSSRENESLKSKLSTKKETLYTEVLAFLIDYLRKEKKPDENEFKEKMIELEKGMLLNSSNAVLLAYGDFMQNFFDKIASNEIKVKRSFILLGNLVIEMRKDLGHGKFIKSLLWFDPLRLWLKDINQIIPKDKSGFRLTLNKNSISNHLKVKDIQSKE